MRAGQGWGLSKESGLGGLGRESGPQVGGGRSYPQLPSPLLWWGGALAPRCSAHTVGCPTDPTHLRQDLQSFLDSGVSIQGIRWSRNCGLLAVTGASVGRVPGCVARGCRRPTPTPICGFWGGECGF